MDEQFLILMYETGVLLKRRINIGGFLLEFKDGYQVGSIGYSVDHLCLKLPDADLLTQDLRDNVSLTDRGKIFAKWLIDGGHKADYFTSRVGGWGEGTKYNVNLAAHYVQPTKDEDIVGT
ncbi:MAG: hypothetical protein LC776_17930 [Acidobacteria bacterium]|nr:hypothetical protein [Acidobacteriota bacterium]